MITLEKHNFSLLSKVLPLEISLLPKADRIFKIPFQSFLAHFLDSFSSKYRQICGGAKIEEDFTKKVDNLTGY